MPMRLLDMKSGALPNPGFFPHVLQPLVDAAARGDDLTPVVTAIVQALGFDSFAYALTTSNRPDKEAQIFVYTTMPAEWMMIYDQKAYCEVDPRMQLVARSTMPILWEQRDFRGKSSRQDEFLNDAAKYGTLSGLIYALYDISHGGFITVFNSKIATVDPARHQLIQRNLPDLLAFGHYFHEWFMKSVIDKGIPSRLKDVPLSPESARFCAMWPMGSPPTILQKSSILASERCDSIWTLYVRNLGQQIVKKLWRWVCSSV